MISVLNFKPYEHGSIKGFFDLRYHGLTIKGARLMAGPNGLWVSLPQRKGEQDGETKYFDQLFLTRPEAEHIRGLVMADLRVSRQMLRQPMRQKRPSRTAHHDRRCRLARLKKLSSRSTSKISFW